MSNFYYVKCKEKDKKAWLFLSAGGVNRLKIHAVRIAAEKIDAFLAEAIADNPEWDFKRVEVSP